MIGPAVSVVVTAYNHERWVEGALESVANQTLRDFELVVMDDCSTDGSVTRIRKWVSRSTVPATVIVNERNLGICAARNVALAQCRGEFVSFLSADDEYLPDKLDRQLAFARRCPEEVALVYSDADRIDVDGADLPGGFLDQFVVDRPEGRVFDRLLRGNFLCSPATLVRRSAISAVGGYDERLIYEDWDMWLRLADRYDFGWCPGRYVRYRIVPGSLSNAPVHQRAMRDSSMAILLKWLGRSRELDQVIVDDVWRYAYGLAPEQLLTWAGRNRDLDRLIARRVWSNGFTLAETDPARGRALLRAATDLDGSWGRRMKYHLTAPPFMAVARKAQVWRDTRNRPARVAGGTNPDAPEGPTER